MSETTGAEAAAIPDPSTLTCSIDSTAVTFDGMYWRCANGLLVLFNAATDEPIFHETGEPLSAADAPPAPEA